MRSPYNLTFQETGVENLFINRVLSFHLLFKNAVLITNCAIFKRGKVEYSTIHDFQKLPPSNARMGNLVRLAVATCWNTHMLLKPPTNRQELLLIASG